MYYIKNGISRMLSYVLGLLNLIHKKKVENLEMENELLKMQLTILQKEQKELMHENKQMAEQLRHHIRSDEVVLRKLIEEFDLLLLETMEPIGDA